MDLILETGEELIVLDFKTSRAHWSAEEVEFAAMQLLIYHELVQPLADGRAVRLEFAVVTKTKFPSLDRHSVSVDPF